ncbi:GntR family transcriptional regulator [Streptomyces sp. SID3212]|nr:GntR family transcriptional regulator [Streptomyces sp. SID3212]
MNWVFSFREAAGQQLPHLRELVDGGEVSKTTVHQAYQALEAEGLVTSSRRHSTVVRQQSPLKRLGAGRYDKAKCRDGDQVGAVSPDLHPGGMRLLHLPSGEPVVKLHRTTYTADGTVVDFAIGVHAASRFAWEYAFKVPDSAQAREDEE